MKKKVILSIGVIALLLVNSSGLFATSGKLKTDSIQTCNGTTYGSHGDGHWHVAVQRDSGWYPSGSPVGYDNPCSATPVYEPEPVPEPVYEPEPQPIIKSSDVSLQNVTINEESIAITDNMKYRTTDEQLNLHIATTDEKASFNVEGDGFEIGDNSRIITVTAEDGTQKVYTLTIIKEKVKSADTSLESVTIGKMKVDIGDTTEYLTTEKSVKIDVKTKDKNAKVKIDVPKELKIGANTGTITVTAENGDITTYPLSIRRISNNVGIDVNINDEKVVFEDAKAKVKVAYDVEKLVVDYKLHDATATVELQYDDTLLVGDNIVHIRVTAESGDFLDYQIKVEREEEPSVIIIILSIATLVGIGYGAYRGFKKIKSIVTTKISEKKKSMQ